MHPRPLYAALLCLTLLVLSCSDTEKPSELMTSPDGALRDGVAQLLNTCPESSDRDLTVTEDSDDEVGVLVYDFDGDRVEIVITSTHPNASVTPFSRTIRYDPVGDFCGTDVITFKLFDGTCYSREHKVDVTITCVNDCPRAFTSSVTTDVGAPVTINLNANDVEGPIVGLNIVSDPAHGTLAPGENILQVRYTPAAGYNGPDSFQFNVSDGVCSSAAATVSIQVGPLDDDDDGVPNADDDCADSILGATVVIDGCETGVLNSVDANGCTLADIIDQHVDAAAETASNHGKFVSAMTKKLKQMVTDGVITDDQKDSIMGCIGSSGFGKIDPTH